jgi:hypothetical protein
LQRLRRIVVLGETLPEVLGSDSGISATSLLGVGIGSGPVGTGSHAADLVGIPLGVVAEEGEAGWGIGDKRWRYSGLDNTGPVMPTHHTAEVGYGSIVVAGDFGCVLVANRLVDSHIAGGAAVGTAGGDHRLKGTVSQPVDRPGALYTGIVESPYCIAAAMGVAAEEIGTVVDAGRYEEGNKTLSP